MCGIAGIFVHPDSDRAELRAVVRAMTSSIRHRGPDGDGLWADEQAGIVLGFRRLAILDLSPTGDQPMQSPSGRFVLVFNGEIYNHQELRADLKRTGVVFRGSSDTEVLLLGIEQWGLKRTLARAAGMFGAAVWDADRRELTLVRDRLGIKPVFLAHIPTGIAFASEIRAFRHVPGIEWSIDPDAVRVFLKYLYVPDPRTVLRKVVRLPPGSSLTIRDPTSYDEPEPYWSLVDVARAGLASPFEGVASDAEEQLSVLLRGVVREHLQSDVPLGTFLSGGIDSSVVTALTQAETKAVVNSYCIAFDDPRHNEAAFSRAVASHLGTHHHEILVTGRDALELVPNIADIFDEPFADPSQIPLALLCRMARREVTVALSGEGGDETFGGYNRYTYAASVLSRLEHTPPRVRRLASAALQLVPITAWDRIGRLASSLLPRGAVPRLLGEKVSKMALMMEATDSAARYEVLLSACQHATTSVLGNSSHAADPISTLLRSSWPPQLLERLLLTDQLTYLPGDQLTKADRVSMASSLELRVPLLDHRVVEFSWRLPMALKIRGTRGKDILRRVLFRYVPRTLVDRPKVGFTVPLAGWLRGPLRKWAADLLASKNVGDAGILDAKVVAADWQAFLDGRSSLALGIWAVVMFQAWQDRWGQATSPLAATSIPADSGG